MLGRQPSNQRPPLFQKFISARCVQPSYIKSHSLTPYGFAHRAKPEKLRAYQHTGLRQNRSPVRIGDQLEVKLLMLKWACRGAPLSGFCSCGNVSSLFFRRQQRHCHQFQFYFRCARGCTLEFQGYLV